MAGRMQSQWIKQGTSVVKNQIDANGIWMPVDPIDSRIPFEIIYRRANATDPTGTIVAPSYRVSAEGATPLAIAGAASTLYLATGVIQQVCPIKLQTPWVFCIVVTNYQNPFVAEVGQ